MKVLFKNGYEMKISTVSERYGRLEGLLERTASIQINKISDEMPRLSVHTLSEQVTEENIAEIKLMDDDGTLVKTLTGYKAILSIAETDSSTGYFLDIQLK